MLSPHVSRCLAAITLCVAVFLASAAGAAEKDFLPAIVYDFGGKFDRSFNQSASEGAEKFKKDTGIAYREFEITNAAQRDLAMAQLAKRGASIIVAVGFTQASAVEKVAKQFPAVKFTIIDAVVDLPNVQSINFREQESSFLCGMAAALVSKTGKVGFVGGMDIPLIRKFALGYAQGVRFVNPAAEVFENMTGTTPAAWGDPTKGAEQMRPGSQFLADLQGTEDRLGNMPVASYRTPMDLVILPPTRSIWQRADNLEFPVLMHPLMLTNGKVLAEIERRLLE